jgi:hypothetical protein
MMMIHSGLTVAVPKLAADKTPPNRYYVSEDPTDWVRIGGMWNKLLYNIPIGIQINWNSTR